MSRYVQVTVGAGGSILAPMLMRPHHHSDLDHERCRVDHAASVAADRANRDFLRFAGLAFIRAAEVNGADCGVARVNAQLRAIGRNDFVPTASARLARPIDQGIVEAVGAALTRSARA